MSDSLWPHELQQARLPCPSLSPCVCSNSCPLSKRCHPTISSSIIPFSCLQPCQHQGLFQWGSRWPKYWSFSFSIHPSNEYSGLISSRMDWFDLLAVQGTLKSLLKHCNENISCLVLSLLYGPIFTSVHDYWKNNSFDCMDLYQQNDISAF